MIDYTYNGTMTSHTEMPSFSVQVAASLENPFDHVPEIKAAILPNISIPEDVTKDQAIATIHNVVKAFLRRYADPCFLTNGTKEKSESLVLAESIYKDYMSAKKKAASLEKKKAYQKEYMKEYAKKNRASLTAQQKEWRQENADAHRAYQREYHRKRRAAMKQATARDAEIKETYFMITSEGK